MTESPFKQIKRGRVSDQITAQIRRLINDGVLKAGQQLPSETELARRFSTSRPTIREALRTLETMGVLEIRAGSGAYVLDSFLRSHSRSENLRWLVERRSVVLKILDVREVLQGLGAKLCAESVAQAQLDSLDETLRIMSQARDENDPDTAAEADTRFHLLIGECAGNEILKDLIQSIEQTYRLSSRALMDLGGRAMMSVQEHASVLEAIAARNGPLAETQMRAHIASVRRAIAALVDDPADEQPSD